MACNALQQRESVQENGLKFKFAFVSDGYVVSRNGNSRWTGVPSDLQAALYEAEDVLRIYGGPNGEYYLRTPSQYYSSGIAKGIPQANINIIAFGPDGGWFVLLSNGRRIWSKVSPALLDRTRFVGESNISTISLGVNGSWALTSKDGRHWVQNVPSTLTDKLQSLQRNGVTIKNIVLSGQNPYWWLEDSRGVRDYWLPKNWHEDIEHIVNGTSAANGTESRGGHLSK